MRKDAKPIRTDLLLVGIPAGCADTCLDDFRRAGYAEATIIGRVIERGDPAAVIRLVDS